MKAEEARKKLNDKFGSDLELGRALIEIEKAVELGRDNVFLYNLSPKIVKELKKLGYDVQSGGDFGNLSSVLVSW